MVSCFGMSGYVQEKETSLSDDYGKDLASVQALQRRHEGFEVSHMELTRDLVTCFIICL